MASPDSGPSGRNAYVVTGPTAGIGRQTAIDLARHGTVVLVGRDPGRLDSVRQAIEGGGGQAVPVVCDLSDLASVRRAAARIIELGLPVAGLVNNAGIMQLAADEERARLGHDVRDRPPRAVRAHGGARAAPTGRGAGRVRLLRGRGSRAEARR